MTGISVSVSRQGLLAGISLGILLSACSGSDSSTPASGTGGSTSNTESTGGAPASGSGGASSAGGSTSTSHSGGASVAGGAPSSGGTGVGTGGFLATGGTSAATGGSKATGGAPAATGGSKAATGGTAATGGSKAATGGTPATGGSKAATGGTPATGGSKSTGGSTGTTGLGAWTTGYVATMYGNSSSGDCAGYSSFSDSTNYDSQTCPNVTKASYSSGAANNASYYGALGDLSSLWGSAPECQCPGGGTGNCTQAPSCPGEAQSGGACGMCVAVKCDPSGSYSSGGSTHDGDCSTTTYVVVQIIDACPHNHPTNVASANGWCTSKQSQHIDLSCSGLGGISTLGTSVGRDGWLNVDVQQVACSIGLGTHSL